MKQNYSNHTRYYTLHHFIFYPIVFILFIISSCYIFKYPNEAKLWMAISGVFFLIGWLSFMLRQHYSLGNQNRIIRLELRLRYYQLTHTRFEEIEPQLSFKQLSALRFASDGELVALVKRAVEEKLSPVSIKKLIINWMPDNMRV